MEKLQKLKVRPLSTQTTTEFGGLCHLPRGKLGLWYDERNLSSDRWPNLSVRPQRNTVQDLDGNDITVGIVAMCAAEHLVILDEVGRLWCNGHSLELPFFTDKLKPYGTITSNNPDVGTLVQMEPGYPSTWYKLIRKYGWTKNPETVVFRYTSENANWNVYDTNGTLLDEDVGEYDPEIQSLAILNVLQWYGNPIYGEPNIDVSVTVQYSYGNGYVSGGAELLLMGGIVIINIYQDSTLGQKNLYWVKLAPLAAGDTLVEGTDYGPLETINKFDDPNGTYNPQSMTDKYFRLHMYSISDGPIKATAVKYGSTAPTAEAGVYWFDSTGGTTQLKTWSVTQQMWVVVESPYTQVYCPASGILSGINEGDVVKLTFLPQTTAENNLTAEEVSSAVALLNGYHKIVKKSGNNTFVIEGLILPDENSTGYQGAKGFYVRLAPAPNQEEAPYLQVERTVPEMDYMIACGNRLWGCRYSEEDNINEIYASKLGDPRNWYSFEGLSTDSWTASRGTAAPFTGAVAYNGNPLFFREESLEKVYPSSTGAHQINTFDLEGVRLGSANSIVIIEDRVFYQSRRGIMVYTGTTPSRTSEVFGNRVYRDGIAARHRRKYMISMVDEETGERLLGVYDIRNGNWHLETDAWTSRAVTWHGDLYYIEAGKVLTPDGAAAPGMVPWSAESCPQLVELPEHKWISYLRIRVRFVPSESDVPTYLGVYIAYDGEGWEPLRQITKYWTGEFSQTTKEIVLFPRRKEHFRLRLEGNGPVEIDSISYRVERSEGGH